MSNVNMTPAKKRFAEIAISEYGDNAVLAKAQVVDLVERFSLGWPSWFVRSPYKVGRGMYKIPTIDGSLDIEDAVETVSEVSVESNTVVSATKTEEVSLATNVIEFPKNVTLSYVPSKV